MKRKRQRLLSPLTVPDIQYQEIGSDCSLMVRLNSMVGIPSPSIPGVKRSLQRRSNKHSNIMEMSMMQWSPAAPLSAGDRKSSPSCSYGKARPKMKRRYWTNVSITLHATNSRSRLSSATKSCEALMARPITAGPKPRSRTDRLLPGLISRIRCLPSLEPGCRHGTAIKLQDNV